MAKNPKLIIDVDARRLRRKLRQAMCGAVRDLLSLSPCADEPQDLGMSIELVDQQEHRMPPIQVSTTDGKKFNLKIEPKNARGRPAQIDGVPSWSSSDETVASITPSDDGKTCQVKCLQRGTATITCDADADLGSGVVDLSQDCVVTVTASNATDLGMSADEPVDDE